MFSICCLHNSGKFSSLKWTQFATVTFYLLQYNFSSSRPGYRTIKKIFQRSPHGHLIVKIDLKLIQYLLHYFYSLGTFSTAKLSGEQPPSRRRRRVASPLQRIVKNFITIFFHSIHLYLI